MTGTRAHAEFDPMTGGVRVAVVKWADEREAARLVWRQPEVRIAALETLPPDRDADGTDAWLRLDESEARALHEALCAHFGGTADAVTLRKYYDAERARVDVFITHLTRGESGRP